MTNETHDNDDRLIDRLVDGELLEDDRRALLARLDAVPDGWRRCALAFLEAQAWRETFGSVASGARTAPVAIVPAAAPRFRYIAAGPMAAALAAGLLAAFTLGWMARGGRGGAAAETGLPSGAVARAKTEVSGAPPSVRAHPPEPAEVARQESPPVPMPDPVVARLESRGYQVDRRQRLVAVETQDGRRMAVPVEEVRLRFVGDRTY